MKVRANKKLDNETFEWCFGAGLSTYKTEEKAIEQDIESSLLEWKNNCFFALNHGIDWRTRLGSKNQKELLDADVIKTISNRYGVYDVTDFVSVVEDRSYTCQCRVITMFSQDVNFSFNREL